MSINRVTISGNLTRDAELRTTQSGASVLAFGVAVNERRKNQQTGEWEDVPNFVDCTLFGNRANALSPHLSKGAKVSIDGRLRYRSWTDQQTGRKRSALEVVVDELEFMSARQQPAPAYAPQPPAAAPAPSYAPQPSQAPSYAAAPAYAPQQPAYAAQAYYDEDIPF